MKFLDSVTKTIMRIPILRVFAVVFLLWLMMILTLIQTSLTILCGIEEDDSTHR